MANRLNTNNKQLALDAEATNNDKARLAGIIQGTSDLLASQKLAEAKSRTNLDRELRYYFNNDLNKINALNYQKAEDRLSETFDNA